MTFIINPYAGRTLSPLTISFVGGTSETSSDNAIAVAGVTASVGDLLVAIIGSDNASSGGASPVDGGSVSDSAGNTWTLRVAENRTPGGAPNDGASIAFFTTEITNALSSGTVTFTLETNVTSKCLQIYRVQPAGGNVVQYIGSDKANGTTNVHSLPAASVDNGNTIICASSMGTNVGFSDDSDTTNGNWSSNEMTEADTGSDLSSILLVSQYKTVTASGDQNWSISTGVAARPSARAYIVLGPA